MSKHLERTVTVHSVRRGPHSKMGNPSFIFTTDSGQFRTQTNTGAAYAVENQFPTGQRLDRQVTFKLTASGRVFDWLGRRGE